MKNFIKYAQYFNLLYADKNYKKEVDYVHSLIRHYSLGGNRTLLDIGCGTGNHGAWFVKKGYRVTGIDRSPEMISIAKQQALPENKIRFYAADAHLFDFPKKFGIAVSLFHVMSYLTANDLFMDTLINIHRHLKAGGLFIFDFWYGPAVLTQKPTQRIKVASDGEKSVRRTAAPKIRFDANAVEVCYKINIKNIKDSLEKEISERHLMRYFFLPELYLMLESAGFKVIKCLKWMSLKEGVSKNSWNGVMISQKIIA